MRPPTKTFWPSRTGERCDATISTCPALFASTMTSRRALDPTSIAAKRGIACLEGNAKDAREHVPVSGSYDGGVEPGPRSEPPSSDELCAARWTRVIVSLRTSQLRMAYLREELRKLPVATAATALEVLCARAEEAHLGASAAMHALVELLSSPALADAREGLRREARESKLL